MFQLKSFLKKSIKQNDSDADSFLSNLSSLKDSDLIKENNLVAENKYNQFYVDGLDFLRLFSESNNNKNSFLQQASECFIEALEIKKNRAEPNFYLAYIAYLMGDVALALKYLKFAAYINPDLPEIKILHEQISNMI